MIGFLSFGRSLSSSAVASSPPISLTCSRTLSTCSCTMTGELATQGIGQVGLLGCAGLGELGRLDRGPGQLGLAPLEAASLSRSPEVHQDRMGLALDLMELPACPFPSRFKVFADYEDYIKCQEKVSELFKVRRGPGPGAVAGLWWPWLGLGGGKLGTPPAE